MIALHTVIGVLLDVVERVRDYFFDVAVRRSVAAVSADGEHDDFGWEPGSQ